MPVYWGCSTKKSLRPLFSRNFSKTHVDIGVGTGYFPAEAMQDAHLVPKDLHVTLVDFSEHFLTAARKHVLSRDPDVDVRCILANAGEPLPESLHYKQFDSASLFLILHCMPGPTTSKAKAIANAKSLLTSRGILIGCTLLGKQWDKTDGRYGLKNEKPRGMMAGVILRLYNKRGIFDNWHNDPNVFTQVLEDEFEHVETRVVSTMFILDLRNHGGLVHKGGQPLASAGLPAYLATRACHKNHGRCGYHLDTRYLVYWTVTHFSMACAVLVSLR